MSGTLQTFKYHSPTKSTYSMKLDGVDNKTYRVGNKIYSVSTHCNQQYIIEADEAKETMKSIGFDVSQLNEEIAKPEFSIEKTGKKVKVNGISGEVWILSSADEKETETAEIVVTDNKKIVEATRGMFELMNILGMTQGYNFFEVEKGYVNIKGTGFELKEFSDKKINSSEYELPKDAKKAKTSELILLSMLGCEKIKQEKSELEQNIIDNTKNEQEEKPESKQNIMEDMKEIKEAVNLLKSFF